MQTTAADVTLTAYKYIIAVVVTEIFEIFPVLRT